MDAADILRLTETFHRVHVADAELVLTEGVRSDALFVLETGVLEVQRRGNAVVRIDEPGSVVGELGLLLRSPATADVAAVGDAVLRRIDDAAAFFAGSPEFARFLATTLARRLWQITTYLSDLQEQYADRGGTLGLVPTVLAGLLGDDRPEPDPGSERAPDVPY